MDEEKNVAKKPDNTELAFKLYDKDKDGFITKSEMSKVSKKLSKEQVEVKDSQKEPLSTTPPLHYT